VKIWLVEPYFTGSHKAWAEGFQAHSRHEVHLLTLPGRFWKWRMQGGAISLARQAQARPAPDLLLASDMLNLPLFLALAGERLAGLPVALYFHENQLTYPLQPGEFFNSAYHQAAFYDELPRLLKHFPDYTELWLVDALRHKSQVLPLGLDLARFDRLGPPPSRGRPLILWNHRWEYDKDPETFFRAIYALLDEGLDFGLILLGESFRNRPQEFLTARERLGQRVVHFGYAADAATYGRLLWQADIVVSTARHEFFGAAVVEAGYCGCFPILPRRLSYPELIPDAVQDACLYDDFEGLLDRLRQAILDIDRTRAFSLRQQMARFDWRVMAPRYDTLLAEVAAGKAG